MQEAQSEIYMHIKFFLEEPSAEVALRHILPKIICTTMMLKELRNKSRHLMTQYIPMLI